MTTEINHLKLLLSLLIQLPVLDGEVIQLEPVRLYYFIAGRLVREHLLNLDLQFSPVENDVERENESCEDDQEHDSAFAASLSFRE